jgi:hypothetical protein
VRRSKTPRASRDDLLRRHAARFAHAAKPRAHHEIGGAGRDGCHDGRQKGRHVAAIAIEEADDLGSEGKRRHAGGAGAPVATSRLAGHSRARCRGLLCGAIGRAVIHDDDVVHALAQDLANDAADRLGLVETGNDHRNTSISGRQQHR